jgi:sugar phosphate isomerase/epimerase
MRLGIGSYTYVWSVGVPGYPAPPRPLTAAGLLAKAAELGVRVVQIADNLPLDKLRDGEIDELARRAARAGIELEVGTRGVRPDHLRRYLGLAVRLGSPVLRVVPDADGDKPGPDEVAAALRSVAPEFERAGVTLAVENHDWFPAAVLAGIMERVGSPAVGVCLDTANSIGCLEWFDTVLAALARWTVNLHVKDFDVVRPPHHKGFVVEGRPAGRGRLDVPGLLAVLRMAWRDPNAIVELWPPPEPTIEAAVAKEEAWARESVSYLRQFIPD